MDRDDASVFMHELGGMGGDGDGESGASAASGASGGAACSGASTQACGRCGVQRRVCEYGLWSAWSACMDEGACAKNETRSCGTEGSERCADDCNWSGECRDQSCRGASSLSCGRCGTQRRTCDNGVWSAPGACTSEGQCTASTVETCESSGTRTCGVDCKWSACTGATLSCTGAATQACGDKCGVQTRACDQTTGMWSTWGACMQEGACSPNSTRACGSGGIQMCNATCSWEAACTSQHQDCVGEAARPCGNCGTQMRTCDTSQGVWSAWGVCSGEGACSPSATSVCGTGGTRTCNASCTWGPCLDCATVNAQAPIAADGWHKCHDISFWFDYRDCHGGANCPTGTTEKQFENCFASECGPSAATCFHYRCQAGAD